MQINCFVDADHAGNCVTRRSQTGILIFLNISTILRYSKAQNTVETSMFGLEFAAMHIAVELLESLRYKLGMFSVPNECVAWVKTLADILTKPLNDTILHTH